MYKAPWRLMVSCMTNTLPNSTLEIISFDFYHTVCDPYDRWRLPHENYDFLFNANMVHISPWKCTESLFANAGVVLKQGGILFMYGPFAINGVLEPKSNQEFDKTLKMNNPQWGIRDLNELEVEASRSQLYLLEVMEMPANNKILVFKLDDQWNKAKFKFLK